MKRLLVLPAVLLLAAAASAQEPPPPPSSPGSRPTSRLVEPRVDELVRRMSERLARAASFALVAEEVTTSCPTQPAAAA